MSAAFAPYAAHPRASGHPGRQIAVLVIAPWIPACAGMSGQTTIARPMATRLHPPSPQAYLQAQSRWHPVEIAFWLATLLPFVLFPNYLSLGEPDRDHRAVRALARPHPRLCRHRVARPRRVLRHRRLYRRAVLQIRLGRAVLRPDRGGRGRRDRRLCHQLHHRALPPSHADHDHARPRLACCSRPPTARTG